MAHDQAPLEFANSPDGTRIAFERAGVGPPLICVDAAGGQRSAGRFRNLAGLLVGRFMVYQYDRRGRGDSTDTRPYAVAREVDDLAALVAAAGEPAFVYGVSSGALLAMQTAAAKPGVRKLALFEPPIGEVDEPPGESEFTAELTRLVNDGRPGDAVEYFHIEIGVPAEMVAEMRTSPAWSAHEAIAHTYVYDSIISDSTRLSVAGRVDVPTLVIDSEGSSGDLTGWAAAVVGALPDGAHRSLAGEWHGVPDEDIASALTEFFLS